MKRLVVYSRGKICIMTLAGGLKPTASVSAGASKERSGLTSPPLISSAAPGLPGTLVFSLVFSPLLSACALAGVFLSACDGR